MNIVYSAEVGWALRATLDLEDFYVGQATDSPFPLDMFEDLNSFILPLDSGCKLWLGGSQYRTRPNCIPYYLNKWIPDYPRQISARQLIIARHLKTHFLTMARFRIGMTCLTPACVEITHMIPYAYYPRTKKGKIRSDATEVVAIETTPEQQAELAANAEILRGSIDPETNKPKAAKILTSDEILKKAFGDKPKLIEEKLKDWQSPQAKTPESEQTTLDDLDITTKNPHK